MRKPSLLYASPFPPQQSGIATYSRWMVQALAEYFDITLYLAPDVPIEGEDLKRFAVLRHESGEPSLERYPLRLYQIGNNPWYHGYIYDICLRYPGWVVMHEYVLYYLVMGLYRDRLDGYKSLYRIGGPEAIAALKWARQTGTDPLCYRHPERSPLNSELLGSANRFIVHSDYTRRLILGKAPDAAVYKLDLAQKNDVFGERTTRDLWRVRYGIPETAVVVASFGFVAPTKLNDVACRAIERLSLQKARPIVYLMVGEGGQYVESHLSDRIKVTGYVGDAEYDDCLAHADVIVNLRYPVMGETSAALLRAFAFGKACIVTDVGWFAELPDDIVLKLDASSPEFIEEHLFEALRMFMEVPGPFAKMGVAAREYALERHDVNGVARALNKLLRGN